ncbi:RNA polymerase sigma factor [Paenisporosarcina sp. TG20]|uniref:RNA polymerase sigma factor n=1 Tax=Paenisporosarcina sp. TG20 TaxID=1211706 RepID=UPI00031925CE|nr:sigma-70 family RNA polymerase sigma factor [Paenisporosarcina sp. TG20]
MVSNVEQLYLDYSDRVYRFIYLLVRHKETAEDLTQETFYKALKSYSQFNHQSTVLTWLLKIARNVTYDHFRRKRIIQFFKWGNENDGDTKNPSPESSAEKSEDLAQLYEALSRLKEDYRDVLILRKVNECSIKETAYILGWTEAKVKSKMTRGFEALRQEFYGKDGVMNGSIKRV